MNRLKVLPVDNHNLARPQSGVDLAGDFASFDRRRGRLQVLGERVRAVVLPTAAVSAPKTICVGKSPCVATLAAAVAAANDGPYSFDGGQTLEEDAHGGGVTAGNDSTLTVVNSHIDRNSITVATPNGEAFAFASGLCLCTDDQTSSTLTVSNSSVSGNSLNVTVASQADVFPGSGDALELDGLGTVSNTQVTGNVTTVRASNGDAIAGPASVETADGGAQDVIANSLIAGNTATAIAPHGKAWVLGGGLVNQGPLLLQNDLITVNRGTVSGQTEVAQGGGIYNGATWFQGGPLTLQNTTVIGNVLSGDSWATLQGGGLFSTSSFPVTLTHSLIAHNAPDNCVGTSC